MLLPNLTVNQDTTLTSPPGVVVTHHPDDGKYVGSPSIIILPNGDYVASHDFFGKNDDVKSHPITQIFLSSDKGEHWKKISTISNAFWSNLFYHNGALYLMGTSKVQGLINIRRSHDDGRTWTTPKDASTGLITQSGNYHTAPVPVAIHNGRIWRAFEDSSSGTNWPRRFNPIMMSAPVDADLLNRDSWTITDFYPANQDWLDGEFEGWLEGNVVILPDGQIADIMRVDTPKGGKAALLTLSEDGSLEFDPKTGFIDFPGGAKKFTIRKDSESEYYWTLANAVPEQHAEDQEHPRLLRNTLVLMRSKDAIHWESRYVVAYHPDTEKHGFQYIDWQFDGDDIIALSRTAWDDENGGPPNQHDANFLTFHRIPNFRDLTMQDSEVNPFE